MFTRRQGRSKFLCAAALGAALAVAGTATPASAQLLDFLFGSRRPAPPAPPAMSYANPAYGPYSPGVRSLDTDRRVESGPSVVYCVRLCDGRFFPIQRAAGTNAAQVCKSFCPATTTKLFSGSRIDHAVAHDGTRYASLENAFVYRERLVEGCTCNGRSTLGVANVAAENDPTLRKGDVVATDTGFVAFDGNRRDHQFTPIASYRGLTASWRERLSETRIVPASTPAPSADLTQAYDADGRRVQLDR